MKGFWKNFLTGLVVILPAFVTFTVVRIVFGWIYGLVIGPVAQLITPWVPPGWISVLVKAAILIGFLVAVALIGLGTRILVIRKIFGVVEEFMRRVPIVGKIYNATREVSKTFQGQKRGVFSRVVLLEWPRKGYYALGFVTSEGRGEIQEKTPEHVVSVFLPTTPNPTSGYLILADKNSLISLDMSVEDGMKLVISGGVVGPEIVKPVKEV